LAGPELLSGPAPFRFVTLIVGALVTVAFA
jgi:hypothetical protein